jgi:diguanylate cyclase (GGDEF)-like protein/putative nucleotidyltransferase with HDIG domain
LIVLFGVLLVLVGVTATAQSIMVSTYASTATLSSIVDGDVATVRGFVRHGLDGVDPASPDPAVVARVNADLVTLLAKGQIVYAEFLTPDGRVIAASDPSTVGTGRAVSADFAAASSGEPRVAVLDAPTAEVGPADLPATVIREYLPLRQGDQTLLVLGVWRDAAPMLTRLDDLRTSVVVVTLSAALIAAAILFVVFRTAQVRINRQTEALVDATRLDPLTGSLNHGALVAHLARDVEAAGPTGAPIAIALIDVDNFRLLNDTHGHRSGDDVLLLVSEAITRELADGMTMGRYGPDEFLVIAAQGDLAGLAGVVDAVRRALSDAAIQFESTDRLPVTVSAGLCRFPDDAQGVTELLTTAAATLREARASGGDRVVVARAEAAGDARTSGFDLFQGLILTIDAKDRYTKHHSEDVSRYGVFLARQLGADEALVRAIHSAGLLHDIGKIGIPDAILRKPGRLTADEYDIVKQHVALGDLIVRDLPDLDEVRAGIRHHHERWDGQGYLHGLAGEEIPLIARILAIGDAFSAMTTTRPYRKALDVKEALVRLGDAAGTQLDERLATVFIRSIETVPSAPLPGEEDKPAGLWTPTVRVA